MNNIAVTDGLKFSQVENSIVGYNVIVEEGSAIASHAGACVKKGAVLTLHCGDEYHH